MLYLLYVAFDFRVCILQFKSCKKWLETLPFVPWGYVNLKSANSILFSKIGRVIPVFVNIKNIHG